jgi:hypothetical protein
MNDIQQKVYDGLALEMTRKSCPIKHGQNCSAIQCTAWGLVDDTHVVGVSCAHGSFSAKRIHLNGQILEWV